MTKSGRAPRPEKGVDSARKPRLVAFNKPYGVVCQFSAHNQHRSLAEFIDIPAIYAAGRLDTDSEGLLLLTADGALQHAIASPGSKLAKLYRAQVEGIPTEEALAQMRRGLDLGDFVTRPCVVRRIEPPDDIWPRDPPIRFRKSIPTSWLEIELIEGKNRQVRRMTAKINLPTLRLIRMAIGPFGLDGLPPGMWRNVDPASMPETDAFRRSRSPGAAQHKSDSARPVQSRKYAGRPDFKGG